MLATRPTTLLVAGATGMLGSRIAARLLDQADTRVRLLMRDGPPSDPATAQAVDVLTGRGAVVVHGDVTDPDPSSLDAATDGVDVVVSALQGIDEVIVDGQVSLAQAAVRSGVLRFLPSDFALDLFAAPPGAPQLDIRRRADREIDGLPLEVVHVLNGAFMDLMLDPAQPGLIDLDQGTVTLWGTGDEPFDLTTVDDTARFTARVATDPADVSGVRYLSGARATFNQIIAETERLTGMTLTRTVLGSLEDLRQVTTAAADPWAVVPEWYLLAMLTGPPFAVTENERYPDAHPTALRPYVQQAHHVRSLNPTSRKARA